METPEFLRPRSPAARLAGEMEAAGHQLYLVGGPVRDLILRRPFPDLDFTTDALPAEVEAIARRLGAAVWLQGARFGTVGLRLDGAQMEVTTFRSEEDVADSRKPDVTFGDSLEVDLSRRDFTVNAMAVELPGMRLVDPHDGLVDLAACRLRTP